MEASNDDIPNAAALSRKELQHYLKAWGLRATGTTAALQISFDEAKQERSQPNGVASMPLPHTATSRATSTPQHSERKRKASPQSKEKRLRRFRSSCPTKIWARIERALSQRLYLVKRGEITKDLQCDFVVLGSTGNIYNVSIGKLPTCNCPDHVRGNHPCKHILFVVIKVMGLPSDSPYLYQLALTSSELQDMFGRMEARRVGGSSVMACARVQSTYAKLQQGVTVEDQEEDGVHRKSLEQDADCPICFDPMEKDSNSITFCRAMCGTNFHADCIRRWCLHNRNCPNCRQPWEDGNQKVGQEGSEGYTNLGSLQGQSPHRDTSTYSPWYGYKRRRYY